MILKVTQPEHRDPTILHVEGYGDDGDLLDIFDNIHLEAALLDFCRAHQMEDASFNTPYGAYIYINGHIKHIRK